ncbi:MAG: hypothetical protein ACXWB9_08990 [Flavisolibacter sp.]
MEKNFRYFFMVLAALPALFITLAWVIHRRLLLAMGNWPEGLPFQPEASLMNQLSWPLKFSNLLLYLVPVGFFLMLLASLVSFISYRKQLPLKHFYLQTFCYLPYLVFVVLLRYPAYNAVNWLINYLG